MTIHPKELQKRLGKINPKLKVIRFSNRDDHGWHGGCDGIHYLGNVVASVPPGNMYGKRDPEYTDKHGTPHRSIYGLARKLVAKGLINSTTQKNILING